MSEPEIQKNISVISQPVDKAVHKSKPKGKNGGARPGAGRPKGGMNKASIEKMAIKKEFEDRVARHADTLFNAQMTLAVGTQYIFRRYKVKTPKGMRWSKWETVTDPAEIKKFLDGEFKKSENEIYMITADKPDAHAIDSLLDRAFGKAPQNLNIKDDRPDPIATILRKFGLLDEEGDSSARQTEGSEGSPPQSNP